MKSRTVLSAFFVLTAIFSCSMAGYKMWWNALEGYPDSDFFKALDPRLENFTSEKAGTPPFAS